MSATPSNFSNNQRDNNAKQISQPRRSIFTVLKDMENEVKDLQTDNKNLRQRLQQLKLELKDERIKYHNTQAISEVRDAIRFEAQKLFNDKQDLTQTLDRKEHLNETSKQITKLKEEEVKRLSEGAKSLEEQEVMAEFIELQLNSKMRIDEARNKTVNNESQIKILQMRKNQLLAQINLLKAAYNSDSQSSPPSIPPVTAEMGLVALPEEIIPDVFFSLVEELQNRQDAVINELEEILREKETINEEMEKDISSLIGSEGASKEETFSLDNQIRELTEERKMLSDLIEKNEKRRRRQGLPASGLQKFAIEYDEAARTTSDMGTTHLAQNEQEKRRMLATRKATPKRAPVKVIGAPKKVHIGGAAGEIEHSVSKSHL